jgi:hypothetical protein
MERRKVSLPAGTSCVDGFVDFPARRCSRAIATANFRANIARGFVIVSAFVVVLIPNGAEMKIEREEGNSV